MKTNLIDTDAIKASQGFFDDISIVGEIESADFSVERNRGYR